MGKTRLTLDERCKVHRNIFKRSLVNYKRIQVQRNVEQTKLIRFELTKVRRNVEKSYEYRTRWLQMHYSKEKRCQRAKILKDWKNTQLLTYRETLLDKTNSVRTCVMYGRTPNGQTELLQWDN